MNQYEVELSLAETESALVNAASSLVDHERRERYIGERIGYYRTLIRRRKEVRVYIQCVTRGGGGVWIQRRRGME